MTECNWQAVFANCHSNAELTFKAGTKGDLWSALHRLSCWVVRDCGALKNLITLGQSVHWLGHLPLWRVEELMRYLEVQKATETPRSCCISTGVLQWGHETEVTVRPERLLCWAQHRDAEGFPCLSVLMTTLSQRSHCWAAFESQTNYLLAWWLWTSFLWTPGSASVKWVIIIKPGSWTCFESSVRIRVKL